jgi:hypothetical protein
MLGWSGLGVNDYNGRAFDTPVEVWLTFSTTILYAFWRPCLHFHVCLLYLIPVFLQSLPFLEGWELPMFADAIGWDRCYLYVE